MNEFEIKLMNKINENKDIKNFKLDLGDKDDRIIFRLLLDNTNDKIHQFRYEISDNEILKNREKAILKISNDQNIFRKIETISNPNDKKLLIDFQKRVCSFFLERASLNNLFHIKGLSKVNLSFHILILPKLLLASMIGSMAVVSSGDLMKMSVNIYNSSTFSFLFFFLMLLLNFWYFSNKDRNYIFPSISIMDNYKRALWPFSILVLYVCALICLIDNFNGFEAIKKDIDNFNILPISVLSIFIGTFIHLAIDKTSSTKPI